jgi:hypothetical protein
MKAESSIMISIIIMFLTLAYQLNSVRNQQDRIMKQLYLNELNLDTIEDLIRESK